MKMDKIRSSLLNSNIHGKLLYEVEKDIKIWHKRFCHLNFNGLKLLQRLNMVHGLPKFTGGACVCEGYAMGK